MKYDTTLSQLFGLTFFLIVLSGLFIGFSLKLSLITLLAAFCMNAGLFVYCGFKVFFNDGKNNVKEQPEVHP